MCPNATVVNSDESSRDYSSVYANDAKGSGHARSMLDSSQAWSATDPATKGEWMQIDLGRMMCVNGAVTQGRKAHGQWVPAYKLSYSADGASSFTELPQLFIGNDKGDESKATNNFNGVKARYIRFIVQTWHNHISMRAAVIASALGIF